jgi:hypothetical protein
MRAISIFRPGDDRPRRPTTLNALMRRREEAEEGGDRRYRPSPSASTPRGGRRGKMGKCVTALRRHYRPTLRLSSPLGYTRDASAHGSAAVRRHFAPGATGWLTNLAGCACALAASAFVAICRWHQSQGRRAARKKPLDLLHELASVVERLCKPEWISVASVQHPNCTALDIGGQTVRQALDGCSGRALAVLEPCLDRASSLPSHRKS